MSILWQSPLHLMGYPGETHTKRTSAHSMALASCPPGLDLDGSFFLAHLICPLMEWVTEQAKP